MRIKTSRHIPSTFKQVHEGHAEKYNVSEHAIKANMVVRNEKAADPKGMRTTMEEWE